jgi:hypothetical protein
MWPTVPQALRAWLEGQLKAGRPTARYLPLYFLVRGRITEALEAHAHISTRGLSTGPEGVQGPGAAQD